MSDHDRGLIRWIFLVAALIFIVLWFASTIATGFSAPAWVPPTGVLCLAIAVAMP